MDENYKQRYEELLADYKKFIHDCNNLLTGICGHLSLAQVHSGSIDKESELAKQIENANLSTTALMETIAIKCGYTSALISQLEEKVQNNDGLDSSQSPNP